MHSESREPKTRRAFLKTTGTVAAGLTVTGLTPLHAARERLALNGGPRAVTLSAGEHRRAHAWPLYGEAEERAVLKLIRNHSYEPIAALEKGV